jgi:hypothetical protein
MQPLTSHVETSSATSQITRTVTRSAVESGSSMLPQPPPNSLEHDSPTKDKGKKRQREDDPAPSGLYPPPIGGTSPLREDWGFENDQSNEATPIPGRKSGPTIESIPLSPMIVASTIISHSSSSNAAIHAVSTPLLYSLANVMLSPSPLTPLLNPSQSPHGYHSHSNRSFCRHPKVVPRSKSNRSQSWSRLTLFIKS